MTKYKKQQTAIRLKKVYSELSQAMSLAEVQHGNKANWEWTNFTGVQFFETYMQPFISIYKDDVRNKTDGHIVYKNLRGERETILVAFQHAQVVTLASGFQSLINEKGALDEPELDEIIGKSCFWVDINGQKKPNQIGKDIFGFCYTPVV